jgi:hypothetical protein
MWKYVYIASTSYLTFLNPFHACSIPTDVLPMFLTDVIFHIASIKNSNDADTSHHSRGW